jgi:uncharacterized protein with FMN-binding domain
VKLKGSRAVRGDVVQKKVLTMKAFTQSLVVAVSPLVGSLATAACASAASLTPPALLPVAGVAGVAAYTDGTYTGPSADAYYGNIQMQLSFKGGQLSNFKLLDYPHHTGTSIEINRQALPILVQEMIAAQSGNVDIVTGATLTSQAFINSVGGAFRQARKGGH